MLNFSITRPLITLRISGSGLLLNGIFVSCSSRTDQNGNCEPRICVLHDEVKAILSVWQCHCSNSPVDLVVRYEIGTVRNLSVRAVGVAATGQNLNFETGIETLLNYQRVRLE
jgi:hypothetical protein